MVFRGVLQKYFAGGGLTRAWEERSGEKIEGEGGYNPKKKHVLTIDFTLRCTY